MASNPATAWWPMIKVCGVRTIGDLTLLQRAGATAVGINLVGHSPRFVDSDLAAELCGAAGQLGLIRVAVMMDPSPKAIADAFDELHVDIVQLHGKESPEILVAFPGKAFIKAVSWSGRAAEREYAEQWSRGASTTRSADAAELLAFLVDAFAPDVGGGSGKRARWDLLVPRPSELEGFPLILAGGLDADNVAQAIEQTRPQGVDVASGVELSPGSKSPEKTTRFASNAGRAFRLIETET